MISVKNQAFIEHLLSMLSKHKNWENSAPSQKYSVTYSAGCICTFGIDSERFNSLQKYSARIHINKNQHFDSESVNNIHIEFI